MKKLILAVLMIGTAVAANALSAVATNKIAILFIVRLVVKT